MGAAHRRRPRQRLGGLRDAQVHEWRRQGARAGGPPVLSHPGPGREGDLMADLKGLYREALKEHPLVVTAPHSQWLLDPDHLRVYTPEAIQFVADALAGKFKHERTGRFSPSSIGGCKRRL